MPKPAKSVPEPPQASPEPSPPRLRSRGRPASHRPVGRPHERPSVYDEQAVERFFANLAAGKHIIAAARPRDCPHHVEIYQRAAREPEFHNRFLRAREAQQDALVDGTIEIANAATQENWQVARLRIQAVQWRAARLASKIYGEKSQLNVIVNDALSDRLTAALKRQRELAADGSVTIDGVAEPGLPAIAGPGESTDKG